jgi:L-aminopeptidase/D-esterase-like protein
VVLCENVSPRARGSPSRHNLEQPAAARSPDRACAAQPALDPLPSPVAVATLPADHLTPLFLAAAEAVEEAIWNALCMADTMTGHLGRTVHAIPLDTLSALR